MSATATHNEHGGGGVNDISRKFSQHLEKAPTSTFFLLEASFSAYCVWMPVNNSVFLFIVKAFVCIFNKETVIAGFIWKSPRNFVETFSP